MHPVGQSIAILSRRALIRQGLRATLADLGPTIRLTFLVPADLVVLDASDVPIGDYREPQAVMADLEPPVLLLLDPAHPAPDIADWPHPPHGVITLAANHIEVLTAVSNALDSIPAGRQRQSVSGGLNAPTPDVLSHRELEVLALIASGLSNEEIAIRLFLGINTVKTYIRTAYRKIGATSRTQAVLWAIDRGVTSPDPANRSRTFGYFHESSDT